MLDASVTDFTIQPSQAQDSITTFLTLKGWDTSSGWADEGWWVHVRYNFFPACGRRAKSVCINIARPLHLGSHPRNSNMHSQNLGKSSNLFANFWDVDSSRKQTKQIVHNRWTCYERQISLLSDTFGALHSEALWICIMMGKFWSCLVRMHVPPFTMESIKALEHGFPKTGYYKDLDGLYFSQTFTFYMDLHV